MTQPRTTLATKKARKLKTLTDQAISTLRSSDVRFFTRGWLSTVLGIEKDEAAAVVSQLKKDLTIEDKTCNFSDFQDPRNRGKYFVVRNTDAKTWVNAKKGRNADP